MTDTGSNDTAEIHERSAGVIIYRTDDDAGRLYLIMQYAEGHWDFAKGKKEIGEDDMQTALREVREETGISDVVICKGFSREIRYEFEYEGMRIHKTVIFFAGSTNTSDISLSDEHQKYAWLAYEDAMSAITYPAARNVLADAERNIK